jgi:hypothetical protein
LSLRSDLSGTAGFGQQFQFALTYAGIPLNVSGYTISVVLKASMTTGDALGTVYTEGGALTVTSALEGQFTWDLPAADTASFSAPGALWYRVDVTGSESVPAPAMYGALWLSAA